MWARTLQNITVEPLEFCLDFPTIARRFEAWWAHEALDRPIFVGTANTNPARPITRRLDLIDQPDAWLEATLADLHQTHWVGDAIPFVRVNLGPTLLSGFFGGKREIGADTAWTHPFIDNDWSNEPDWTIREDNYWWNAMRRLTALVAEDAVGRYLIRMPVLGGAGDVLLSLRGAAEVCMDVFDKADLIRAAVEKICVGWRQAFIEMFRLTVGLGAGLIHWVNLWSSHPYMVAECDLNALIGPKHFAELFAPEIASCTATAERGVFHLDGPDAARCIDVLLDLPELQAIQFTPGAGTPSALAWVEMFRKIQKRGKSLEVICPPEEVLALCQALRPEGLAIWLDHPLSPGKLDDLFAQLCKLYSCT